MCSPSMCSPLWTAAQAAQATGGKALLGRAGDWHVTGVSIDSRSLQAGDLFVPLTDVRDGHEFIPQARAAGAGAVMSAQDMDEDTGAPALIVDDVLEALTKLGQAACARSNALRIGVTGSVGKTSVKEALAHMFAGFGSTHKSLKSYNNHWGVPLTMARMARASEYGVFELGMNHAGEMSVLSKMLRPDIAIITNVAGAHLAHFKNIKAIALAKAEVIDGLSKGSTLILNGDNEYSALIREQAEAAGINSNNILSFGRGADNDVAIVDVRKHPQVTNIRLRIEGQQIDVTLPLVGDHWVSNVAGCMAVAKAAGIDLRKAARRFRTLAPIKGRGMRHDLILDGKALTVIDESYNANPASMRAAIDGLSLSTGRKLAVLGDMLELGADELEMHAALSAPLRAANAARVFMVGTHMRALERALPSAQCAGISSDWRDVKKALLSELSDGDTVLIKGSNATGLGRLVADLIKDAQIKNAKTMKGACNAL